MEVNFSSVERFHLLERIAQTAVLLHSSPEKPLKAGEFSLQPFSPSERMERLSLLWQEVKPLVFTLCRQPEQRLTSQSVPTAFSRSRGGQRAVGAFSRFPQTPLASSKQASERLFLERQPRSTSQAPLQEAALRLLEGITAEAEVLSSLAAFCLESLWEKGMNLLAREVRGLRVQAARHWGISLPSAAKPSVLALTSPLSQTLFGLEEKFHNPNGFAWKGEPWYSLNTRPLWELYELYCFASLVGQFLESGWRLREGNPLEVSPQGIYWRRVRGEESRLVFKRESRHFSLLHQPLYPAQSENAAGAKMVSRSHALRPDFVLEFESGSLIVLDAKCRTYPPPESGFRQEGTALQEDINKMHTYRDALIQGSRPVVLGAYCLFPGSPADGQNIIAYPASSPQHPLGTGGVGAIRLRPGHPDTESNLAAVLPCKSWPHWNRNGSNRETIIKQETSQ